MLGNITTVKKGERKSTDPTSADFKTVANAGDYRSYTYDDLSQLTREDNKTTNLTNLWTYDRLGNIQTKTEYNYTEDTSISADRNLYVDYQYGTDSNTSFNKLLKNIDVYNGTSDIKSTRYAITYDEIGNPTKYEKISYDTDGTTPLSTTTVASLNWRGRQLLELTDSVNSNSITYRYGAEGLRKSKTVNGVKTQYYYVGDTLTYQICEDGTELYFFYDSRGALSVIRYLKGDKDYHFYVATNLQGDVVGIYTATGLLRASYEYDAWGNVTVYSVAQDSDGKNVYTKITNEAASGNIGAINPIRYRGYYYDTETGFYYLQSRYYCPKIGRFINADIFVNTAQDINGYNIFSYCYSNPVILCDKTGFDPYYNTATTRDDTYVSIFDVILIGLGLGILFSSPYVESPPELLIPELEMPKFEFAKKSKSSGKELANNPPSWVNKGMVDKGKSAEENAWRILNDKYGRGNWGKGPGSEFNKIKKWLTRSCGLKSFAMTDDDIYIMDGHLIVYDNSGRGFGWFDGNYLEFYD